MKINKYLALFFVLLVIANCEKGFDLPRDNPYDQNFEGGENDLIKNLSFLRQNVACKQDGFQFTDENIIKPGDKVWLNVVMENTGNSDINGIRAEITSTSNIVILEPPPAGMYLKFSQGSSDDYIGVSNSGWGEFTNGQSYKFAPNNNSYSVEFQVDSLANSGDNIDFQITSTDDIGNTWTETFMITIE